MEVSGAPADAETRSTRPSAYIEAIQTVLRYSGLIGPADVMFEGSRMAISAQVYLRLRVSHPSYVAGRSRQAGALEVNTDIWQPMIRLSAENGLGRP